MNKLKQYIAAITLILLCLAGCKKDFLEGKSDKSLIVPESISDFQALLDNYNIMNANVISIDEMGSDGFNLLPATWAAFSSAIQKNAYIWEKDVYAGDRNLHWVYTYQKVYYANLCLEGLARISEGQSSSEYNNVKGSALFFRAESFYQLLKHFSPLYNNTVPSQGSGIPLRLNSSVDEPIIRSSVSEAYQQVIKDLLDAKGRLPVIPVQKTRPSRPAAFALLARIYMVMGDYNNAYANADSCLQLYAKLLNYSQLNTTAAFPFVRFNDEVIFHNTLLNTTSFTQANYSVDPDLYSSYNSNDKRKALFFKSSSGRIRFGGSYNGSAIPFSGIATDEVYLIRAESSARLGKAEAAIADLNTLMEARWASGLYIPYLATNADDALKNVLTERRKELILRGTRWMDLRRLNTDPQFAVTLTRTIGTDSYSLPPNDARYIFPIPVEVLQYNPDMSQNIR